MEKTVVNHGPLRFRVVAIAETLLDGIEHEMQDDSDREQRGADWRTISR